MMSGMSRDLCKKFEAHKGRKNKKGEYGSQLTKALDRSKIKKIVPFFSS